MASNSTKVNAIQCLHCHDIIYSCVDHDYHPCSCGAVAIDGGFDYIRVTGDPSKILSLIIHIPVSKEELYNDWNTLDKPRRYGCIKV